MATSLPLPPTLPLFSLSQTLQVQTLEENKKKEKKICNVIFSQFENNN